MPHEEQIHIIVDHREKRSGIPEYLASDTRIRMEYTHLNLDDALGFRDESWKSNEIRCSTIILTRKHGHHHGENRN